jgi:hypothetical protein
LTVIKALNTLLKKRWEKANKEFKKATTAVRIDINKKKNTLKRKGIQARKNKRERRRYTGQFLLRALIPLKVSLKLFTLIRDPKKEPNMSQNANDRGQFVEVKTRLTTKRKGECKERGDYIYVTRG